MRPGNEVHNRTGRDINMADVGEIIETSGGFISGERGGQAMDHGAGEFVPVVVSVKKRYVYEVRLAK